MPYLKHDKPSAAEIIAFDDAQLDQYLEEQGRVVKVKDPENLTEAFIQRLRDRTDNPKSQPVDSQQLMARLREAPAFEERYVRCPTEEWVEEPYEEKKQRQVECYRKLVEDGGWPTHPVERMEETVKDPGELREILSFFQSDKYGFKSGYEDWEVYAPQLGQWLRFRNIQSQIRQGRFSRERDLFYAVQCDTWDEYIERYPEDVHGKFGFTEYAQLAKERLVRNGITHAVEFDADATKQDKLTTWLEYVNWEYMYYERFARSVKVDRKDHAKAWQKLVDSGELRKGETEEIVLTTGMQRSAERHSAEAALEAAQRELAQAEQAPDSSSSRAPKDRLLRRQQQLNAALARVESAEKAAAKVWRRNKCISEFINSTRNYRLNTDCAERHGKLVRWMVQQIPLIEQEEASVARDPHAAGPIGEAVGVVTSTNGSGSGSGVASSRGNDEAIEMGQQQSPQAMDRRAKRRRDGGDDDSRLAKRIKHGTDAGTQPAKHKTAPSTNHRERNSAPNGADLTTKVQVQEHVGRANLRDRRQSINALLAVAVSTAPAKPRRSARITAQARRDHTAIPTLAKPPRRTRRSAQEQLPSPPSSQSSRSNGGISGIHKGKSKHARGRKRVPTH